MNSNIILNISNICNKGERLLCQTELFELELLDHLTVCKQMTDV